MGITTGDSGILINGFSIWNAVLLHECMAYLYKGSRFNLDILAGGK